MYKQEHVQQDLIYCFEKKNINEVYYIFLYLVKFGIKNYLKHTHIYLQNLFMSVCLFVCLSPSPYGVAKGPQIGAGGPQTASLNGVYLIFEIFCNCIPG